MSDYIKKQTVIDLLYVKKPPLMASDLVQIKYMIETDKDFITTIESQNSQIESLKAITELAVKGLKEIACLNVDSAYSAGTFARNTLSEIERLQNGTS